MTKINASVCLSEISQLETSFIHGELNVPGLVGILVFYAIIFGVGIYASWRGRKQTDETRTQKVMLAGRDMNAIVGVFTLTATWMGGDYINGTAEFMMTPGYGLVWCLFPLLVSLSLVLNGVLFAKKMWKAGYVTMLDPFEEKFGRFQTVLLYIACLLTEMCFSAVAFAVLGSTLNVIVGISYLWAVILSAVVALLYTLLGGLSSVAYTDVVQLIGIIFGLVLSIPFAMRHSAVSPISETMRGENSWLGDPPTGPVIGLYIDTALMLFFGAAPWQMYFQRCLSQKSASAAKTLSIIAAFVCLVCSVPSVVIGAIAASTDWNATGYRDFGTIPVSPCDYTLALPMVLRFLTPVAVGVIGLGAVSAAVMSSTDSVILSTSSMFTHNVYEPLRNAVSRNVKKPSVATDNELLCVLRVAMVVVTAMTTIIALTVKSVLALVMLSVDIPYCIIFPQFVCVLFLPFANSYGSCLGVILGLVFRGMIGEHLLGIPPVIKFPRYSEELQQQLFPCKTLITIFGFVIIIAISWLTREMARRFQWFRTLDKNTFKCFQQKDAVYHEKDPDIEPDTYSPLEPMKSSKL